MDRDIAEALRVVGWRLACQSLQEAAREMREHLSSVLAELPLLAVEMRPDDAGQLVMHVKAAMTACEAVEQIKL